MTARMEETKGLHNDSSKKKMTSKDVAITGSDKKLELGFHPQPPYLAPIVEQESQPSPQAHQAQIKCPTGHHASRHPTTSTARSGRCCAQPALLACLRSYGEHIPSPITAQAEPEPAGSRPHRQIQPRHPCHSSMPAGPNPPVHLTPRRRCNTTPSGHCSHHCTYTTKCAQQACPPPERDEDNIPAAAQACPAASFWW